MSTKLTAIYARDKEGVIGVNGNLPWNQPRDLKHFKDVTHNHVVIMGFGTFKSLNNKPLVDRTNIILTNKSSLQTNRSLNSNSVYDDVIIVNSVEECLKLLDDLKVEEAFVIGGEVVFNQFKPYLNKIIETEIQTELNSFNFADYITFIDHEDLKQNMKLTSKQYFKKDDRNFAQIISIYEKLT